MIKQLAGASLIALIAAAPFAAHAQDDEETSVDPLVLSVSLSGEGVQRSLTGGSVTVITPADMEDRQVRLVTDLLRDVPGVEVSRSGAIGGLTQVRIRGAEGNHTLTLVDGIELSSPYDREVDFASLIAEDGGSLEVLRGQQSALYGSEAVGGVIQYFSPDGRRTPGTRIRAEAGTFETLSAALTSAGAKDDFDYSFAAALHRTDGTTNTRDEVRELPYANQTVSTRLRYNISDDLRVYAVGRFVHVKADTNGTTDAAGVLVGGGTDNYTNKTLIGKAGVAFDALDDRWTNDLSIQATRADRKSEGAFGPFDTYGKRSKVTYVTAFSFGDSVKQKITGSVDMREESFYNTFDTTERGLDNVGVVGIYDARFNDNAAVGLSVRNDNPEQFDDFTSYRASGTYTFASNTRVRVAAGSGIQYPTASELYGFFGTFVGNPNLTPEKSEGWEIGVEQKFLDGDILVGITYFDNEISDRITSGPGPLPGQTMPVNAAGQSTQQGVEVFMEARLADAWNIDVSYTSLDAKDPSGLESVRRASSIASFNLTWLPSDAYKVNLNVRYNGEQEDNVFPFFPTPSYRATLPAFTLVNVGAEWKVNDGVTLFGRADNLFDETYEEVFSYRGPGREVSIGLKAKL